MIRRILLLPVLFLVCSIGFGQSYTYTPGSYVCQGNNAVRVRVTNVTGADVTFEITQTDAGCNSNGNFSQSGTAWIKIGGNTISDSTFATQSFSTGSGSTSLTGTLNHWGSVDFYALTYYQSSYWWDGPITITGTPCSEVNTTIDTTICAGDSIQVLSNWYSQAATYIDTATAVSGCDSILTHNLSYYTNEVDFSGVVSTSEICVGDTAVFTELITEGLGGISSAISGSTYLPDGSGQVYSTSVTVAGFGFGDTLTSGTLIDSLYVSMEHSYLGDIEMWLTCPNGSSVAIVNSYSPGFISGGFSGGGTFLGDATDNISGPGVGWQYSFSEVNATWGDMATEHGIGNTIISSISSGPSMNPNGVYLPEQTFNDLVGCPLNGNWTLYVSDNQGQDDGYIFGWGIFFAGGDIDTLQGTWSGSSIISSSGNETIANPAITNNYAVTVIDNNGCQHDSTYTVIVNPIIYNTATASINSGDSILIGGVYETTDGVYNEIYSAVNGCDSIVAITLSVIGTCTFNINIAQQQNVSCYGLCDGYALAVPIGATQPVAVQWDNGHQQGLRGQLCAGVYTVSMSDAAGCVGSTSVTITEPSQIEPNLNITNSNCGDNDGEATTSVTGGTPPYNYQWSSGSLTSSADSLSAGVYLLRIEDAEGCELHQPVIVSDNNGPQISFTKNNVSCNGVFDGSIDVSVSNGTAPYSYYWSSGMLTEDITGLQAGPYEIDVTDANGCVASQAILILQPSEITPGGSVNDATCGGSDGYIMSNIQGGTTPYTYNWSNAASTPNISGLVSGIYQLTITDANGCQANGAIPLSEIGAPVVQLDSILHVNCGSSNGSVYITPVSGSSAYSYVWSAGGVSEDMLNQPAGNYSVTVTGANGCSTVLLTNIEGAVLDTPSICIVTVDTITLNNLVVWQKAQGQGISAYNVYKESTTANVYFLAGTVPYDSTSIYHDSLSNPMTRSWRYRITALDSCGNESALSPIHKTIHLTQNIGLSNTINLIWDDYEGFPYGTYYINRFKQNTGWVTIDSIPSNLNSYTDATPPLGNMRYSIEVKHPDGCDADAFKATNYSSSRSNRPSSISVGADTTGTGTIIIDQGTEGNIKIYPNPTQGNLVVESSDKYTLIIQNVLGTEVKRIQIVKGKNAVDISDQPAGIYLLGILNQPAEQSVRIIKH
jgi:subtilisin-like proprotein convertase family protein